MQPTFGMIDDQVRRKKITMLDQIADVIDFRRIEKILLKAYKGGGRPPIPAHHALQGPAARVVV